MSVSIVNLTMEFQSDVNNFQQVKLSGKMKLETKCDPKRSGLRG